MEYKNLENGSVLVTQTAYRTPDPMPIHMTKGEVHGQGEAVTFKTTHSLFWREYCYSDYDDYDHVKFAFTGEENVKTTLWLARITKPSSHYQPVWVLQWMHKVLEYGWINLRWEWISDWTAEEWFEHNLESGECRIVPLEYRKTK